MALPTADRPWPTFCGGPGGIPPGIGGAPAPIGGCTPGESGIPLGGAIGGGAPWGGAPGGGICGMPPIGGRPGGGICGGGVRGCGCAMSISAWVMASRCWLTPVF